MRVGDSVSEKTVKRSGDYFLYYESHTKIDTHRTYLAKDYSSYITFYGKERKGNLAVVMDNTLDDGLKNE